MRRSQPSYAREKASRETKRSLLVLESASESVENAPPDVELRSKRPRTTPPEQANLASPTRDAPLKEAGTSFSEQDVKTTAVLFMQVPSGGEPREEAAHDAEILCFDRPRQTTSESDNASEGKSVDSAVGDGLREYLRDWAVVHCIKRRALTELVKVLRDHGKLSSLPKDGRTLLRTPRKLPAQFTMTPMTPGYYCHLGLAAGLQHSLSQVDSLPAVVPLTFNMDGLPLSKSSKRTLWPIQCLPQDCGDLAPFLVGAFAGRSKPKSANEFLRAFVEELRTVLSQGLVINNRAVKFTLKAIICDAPARAHITGTKYHPGYNSCPKCTVEGEPAPKKVVFIDIDCPLRTDLSFRQQHDPDHHREESLLLELPIDMVQDLPLDYMHVVLLGVMRKLLVMWSSKGPVTVRFGPLQRRIFDEWSVTVQKHIPSEFPRKSRCLDDLDRWKAVEFRLFLFYTGPFILKFCMEGDLYQHFLVLHASLSILANHKLCRKQAGYARELLRYFVSVFVKLYGKEYATYNVHCLIHLANDAERYGALDSFSAFPFENNMQVFKKQLRRHGKTLEQLCNRTVEAQSRRHSQGIGVKAVTPSRPHSGGLLLPECRPPEYRKISLKNFTIALSERDHCFSQDGHVVVARNIAHMKGSGELCIIGQEFCEKEDLYTVPFESSRLGICVMSRLSELKPWPVRNLRKMVKLPWKSKFVVLPELHTA